MRAIALYATILSLGLCFAGGMHADPADWTVMVWMNGDNNLEAHIVGDAIEMGRVNYSGRVNVVIQLDTQDKNGTYRYKVPFEADPTINDKPKISERNMVDGDQLKEFVAWAMTNYEAKRYAFIISSHGSGPRVILPGGPGSQPADPASGGTGDKNRLPDGVFGSPNRAITSDDSSPNNDVLYNSEIAGALRDALAAVNKQREKKGPIARLDLIGFDACLMGMVEMAYGLRNVAAVLVASEELIPAHGWRYDHWLPALDAHSTENAEWLGKLLVDTYAQEQKLKDDADGRTLAAFNITRASALGGAITELSKVLIAEMDAQRDVVEHARELCIDYAVESCETDTCFFHADLARLVDLIAANDQASDRVRAAAGKVKAWLQQNRIANWAGEERSGDEPDKAEYGSEGLAIYFPPLKENFDTDKLTGSAYIQKKRVPFPIEFVNSEQWAVFLQAYYKKER
jgi:hypothetical protein